VSSSAHQTSGLSASQLFWLLVFAALLLGFNVVAHLSDQIGDEAVHQFQINWFRDGRFEIFKYITMLPLYHAVVAAISKVSGLASLNGLRFSHLCFASGLVVAMVRLTACFYPQERYSRTLLLIFVPFVFPLFFLTYTDLPSLMFVLFMVERAWRKSYFLAALFALLAVLTRQPNIIWVTFTVCLIALNIARDRSVSLRFWGEGQTLADRDYLLEVLKTTKYFVVVFVLFIGFVLWNGGVAIGDAEQHPVSFNLSNLYFFLLVAFVLFLPFNIEQLPSIVTLIRRHWWIILVLIAAFIIYFNTYEHPHKYNATALAFYRHNLFIHYTCDILPLRILSFFPMAWMSLSLVTAIQRGEFGAQLMLLVPFALLSFVPLPLIEQRYYFVSLALLLALRPPMSIKSTTASLFVFIALSAYVMFNITRQIFFL